MWSVWRKKSNSARDYCCRSCLAIIDFIGFITERHQCVPSSSSSLSSATSRVGNTALEVCNLALKAHQVDDALPEEHPSIEYLFISSTQNYSVPYPPRKSIYILHELHALQYLCFDSKNLSNWSFIQYENPNYEPSDQTIQSWSTWSQDLRRFLFVFIYMILLGFIEFEYLLHL